MDVSHLSLRFFSPFVYRYRIIFAPVRSLSSPASFLLAPPTLKAGTLGINTGNSKFKSFVFFLKNHLLFQNYLDHDFHEPMQTYKDFVTGSFWKYSPFSGNTFGYSYLGLLLLLWKSLTGPQPMEELSGYNQKSIRFVDGSEGKGQWTRFSKQAHINVVGNIYIFLKYMYICIEIKKMRKR